MTKQLILLTILASVSFIQSSFADEQLLDKIIAIVNNGVILQSELDRESAQLQKQAIQSQQRLPNKAVLDERILERLIQDKIQIQHAANLGISVDDETLNRAIQSIARNNKMDLSTFRKVLRDDGINFQDFRSDIRNELTISRLRNREIDTKITVSSREVEALMTRNLANQEKQNSYDLQHILLSVPEGASSEQIQQAQTKIQQLHRQLNEGADFSQLAVSHSDGARALDGGNIGWRKPQELPELFAKAIISLDKGKLSSILRSPNGFHILKVKDIRNEEKTNTIETKTRHILLKTDSAAADSDRKREELLKIRQKITDGMDFASLAQQFSDDTNSASNGGELPWYKPGEMVPIFEKITAALEKGELSEPFRSKFGWHIVQLMEQRNYATDNKEDSRAQAEATLRKTKADEEYELWLRRLRADTYVEIRDSNS